MSAALKLQLQAHLCMLLCWPTVSDQKYFLTNIYCKSFSDLPSFAYAVAWCWGLVAFMNYPTSKYLTTQQLLIALV